MVKLLSWLVPLGFVFVFMASLMIWGWVCCKVIEAGNVIHKRWVEQQNGG